MEAELVCAWEGKLSRTDPTAPLFPVYCILPIAA